MVCGAKNLKVFIHVHVPLPNTFICILNCLFSFSSYSLLSPLPPLSPCRTAHDFDDNLCTVLRRLPW